jgi:transporter family-2 protein
MKLALLIPITLCCVSILQGTINRQISEYIGVTQATLVGNIATVIVCILFYVLVKNFEGSFSPLFHIKAPLTTYRWWFVIPAIFGFMIVAGMPWGISQLGAVKMTVLLIVSQMITSVLWDYFVEHLSINIYKGLGIIFAILSVIMVTISKQA